MPEWLHKKLESEARIKGLKGRRKDAYVYGTLKKQSVLKVKPKKRKTQRGH